MLNLEFLSFLCLGNLIARHSGICECLFPCPAVCITYNIWLSFIFCVLLVLTSPRLCSYYLTIELHQRLSPLWQTKLSCHLIPLLVVTLVWQVYITDNGAFTTVWSTMGLCRRESRAKIWKPTLNGDEARWELMMNSEWRHHSPRTLSPRALQEMCARITCHELRLHLQFVIQ